MYDLMLYFILMGRVTKHDELIALRLPSEQHQDMEWLRDKFGYGSVSEVIRRSVSLFADLHRLEILGVDVETRLARDIEGKAAADFGRAIEKFEALRRALDIVIEAIEGKGRQKKRKTG
jgi:Arc/MetJ-type ribon-helix-helix transcriptional regulator